MAVRLRVFLCGMAMIVVLWPAGSAGSAAAATPGLVAAYSFESAAGATDDSGNGNTGTTKNTTWVSSGRRGAALPFDGTSSWVTVPDSASLHFTTGLTVEAWVDPSRPLGTTWQAVAVKEGAGGIVFGVYANSNRSLPAAIATAGTTQQTAYGSRQVRSSRWTHLAETFDGSAVRIYVNGTLRSTTLAAGSLPASTSPLRFGGDSLASEFFGGLIDDVRVYSRSLSASEITSDMNTPVVGAAAPPDTQPPSTPGGLVASTVGQTSVTLSWSPASDNTGVSGYGVYRDGVQVGSSTTTSATVSGLVCATSYSLGVDAVDAAGNRSARATIAVTTAACPAPGTGASFFVAPGGSDAGSCTSAQPCATFNRAVTLASPGQVVQTAGGAYPAQVVSAVKAGPAPVVVQPAPGATVTLDSLDVSGSYVEVRSMALARSYSVEPAARFATLRDIHSPHGWVVGDNTTIVGGEIGPLDSCATGLEDGLQIWQRNSVASSHVTLDGVYIHDISDHDNSCAGFPNTGVHDDCVQILAGHYTTIRNSTFYNCPTSNVIARPYLDSLDHLTIEGNMLNPERRAGASLSIGSTGDTCASVVIQYNTAIGASSIFNCSTSMIVRGNIFPAARGGLCSYQQTPQYSYNAWQTGPACGASDRVCTLAFVSPASLDFHLATTDTCAKDHGDPANYPATDFDGQQRPLGAGPDAGADEVG